MVLRLQTITFSTGPSPSRIRKRATKILFSARCRIAQANRYADTETVKRAVGTTQLHKIVVVYKDMEMRVCEELD